MTVHLTCFGKLNLFLKINTKKWDGLHPIFSLFHNISLFDNLVINETKEKSIYIESNVPALKKDNILIDIFNFLFDYLPCGFNIVLTKKIPIGGGMGGGSCNAAAFLFFLNKYYNLNYSDQMLLSVATQFGSDIPYF